jgi:5-methylthioadenosine/S-adenosylhomocysteine deaminase
MKANESLLLSGGLVLDPESGTANRKDLLIEDGHRHHEARRP